MSNIKTKLLQAISNCCHPMAMFTYAITFICFFTPIIILPLGIRLFMVLEVMFYTFAIPLLTIWLLYKLKVVSHWALRKREDRTIPLIANLLCYIACTLTVQFHGFVPMWGMCVFYGATAIAIISWIISFWWKISGHALAISALTLVLWMYYFIFPGFVPLWMPFIAIILTGLVCSIRVFLGRHTLAQVYAGTAVGVVLMWSSFQIML